MERHPEIARCYLGSLSIVLRHRKLAFVVVGLMVALSVVVITRGNFSNDISLLLPDGSESARVYRTMNRSEITNRVVISFGFDEGAFKDVRLGAFLERTAGRLQQSPLVRRVEFRSPGATLLSGLAGLTEYLPQLRGEEAVDELRKSLKPTECRRVARRAFRRLMSLTGIGQGDMIRSDPYGLKTELLRDLEIFGKLSGVEFATDAEYLINPVGTAAMMVIHTTVSAADTIHSRELMDMIDHELSDLPSGVSHDIIAAHLRSLHNENLIRSDLQLISVVSLIGFALLFFLFYRADLRSLRILLMPLLAAVMGIALVTLLFDATLVMILGMGAVVIGLGIDYGIHVYASIAGGRSVWRVSRIVFPLAVGTITTVAVFSVFLFSGVEGYRQLGFFAGASLLVCLVLALTVLPVLLRGSRGRELGLSGEGVGRLSQFSARHRKAVCLIWVGAIAVSLFGLGNLRIDDDVTQFDSSSGVIEEADQRFRELWQTGQRGAFVGVIAPTRQEALEKAETTGDLIEEVVPRGQFFDPTSLCPSEVSIGANLASWKRFRQSGELDALDDEMARQAEQMGMGADFFEPFFAGIHRGIDAPPELPPKAVAPLLANVLQSGPEGASVLLVVPGDGDVVNGIREILRDDLDCAVISGDSFRNTISEEIMGAMTNLAMITLPLVVLMTLLFLRRVLPIAMALTPVFSSLVVTGAVLTAMGVALNVSICIAAIILAGLAVDYGVFVAHASWAGGRRRVLRAITLSAATSVAGAGAVIFASHPMLHYAGVTLVIGIAVAWLASIFVVPALISLLTGDGRSIARVGAPLLGIVLLLSGCKSSPFEWPEFPPLPDASPAQIVAGFNDRQAERVLIDAGIVFEMRGGSLSALCAARIDSSTRNISVTGMTMLGVTLFEVSGEPDNATLHYVDPQMPVGDSRLAEGILVDMGRVHFDNVPETLEESLIADGRLVIRDRADDGTSMEFTYAGNPARLISKRSFQDGELRWEVGYFEYRPVGSSEYPVRIVFDNHEHDYRLIIRTRGLRETE